MNYIDEVVITWIIIIGIIIVLFLALQTYEWRLDILYNLLLSVVPIMILGYIWRELRIIKEKIK